MDIDKEEDGTDVCFSHINDQPKELDTKNNEKTASPPKKLQEKNKMKKNARKKNGKNATITSSENDKKSMEENKKTMLKKNLPMEKKNKWKRSPGKFTNILVC